MRGVAALVLLALAGCAPQARAPAPGLTLVPASTGLEVAGTGQEIGFGRFLPSAVASVTRILGRDPDLTAPIPGCELTVVGWSREGLTLYFDRQGFAGWRAGGGDTFPGPARTSGLTCA